MGLLQELSPNLNGVLQRSFDEAERESIEVCFEFSVEESGTGELDFVREEGVSFNPRQARIPLILIKETSGRSADEVAAGILMSCLEIDSISGAAVKKTDTRAPLDTFFMNGQPLDALLQRARDAGVSAAACDIVRAVRRIREISGEDSDPQQSGILAALWLDRARHLHQAEAQSRETYLQDFRHVTELVMQLARPFHDRLYLLLTTWYERYFPLLESRSSSKRTCEDPAQ